VPDCSAPSPSPIGKLVVYYSGKGSAGAPRAWTLGVDRDLTADGTYDGRWTPSTHCIPDQHAVNFAAKDINRLAGWSPGRLGPIYALKYMKDHNQTARAKRINYVLMYDPGAPADFGECDYNHPKVQADATLAWWLQLSTDNRLVILSGNDTAIKHHQTIQRSLLPGHQGAGTTVRKRVIVCNYTLSHAATYNNYAYLMTNNARLSTTQGLDSCPRQGSTRVWGWNP
jgi:hypothetical protein